MQKRLSAFGNSLGIVIEKPILQLLDIDRNTVFNMTTDGDSIVLRPIREAKSAPVAQATEDGEEAAPIRQSDIREVNPQKKLSSG